MHVDADLRHLPQIEAWIGAFCERCAAPPEMSLKLLLAVEELMSNLIEHGAGAGREVDLALDCEGEAIVLTFEDRGAAFDPTAQAAPDLTAEVADRRAGGLGLHLIRRLMDEVAYSRVAERNRLVMRKQL